MGKLIVIAGTNASGKSGLGVELASRYGGEIVSADSRQVFRGLDLGSGKITPQEMRGVPHHLIDVCQPGDFFSMADFQRLAYADSVSILEAEPENLDGMVTCATSDAKLYIPMGQLVDVAKELDRISKELEKARKNLAGLEGKLSNEKFVSRAPEAVVAAEREKAQKARDLIAGLEESAAALKKLVG